MGGFVIDDMNRRNTFEAEGLESLMHRYQQADATAATLLAENLSRRLCRFFLAQVRDRDRAEDLLQECWLRIHKSRHTYRPGEPLLPWIYGIARRVQVDAYRKSKRIAQHELQNEDVESIPVATLRSESSPKPDLSELLKTLPPQQKEAVLLLKVAGLSLEEVARATGVSVGAVKQRLTGHTRAYGGSLELNSELPRHGADARGGTPGPIRSRAAHERVRGLSIVD